MSRSCAPLSALPIELATDIVEILQQGSAQDVVSFCASSSDARRFCQARVIPWQRRYANLGRFLGDVGDRASILDIAHASLRAQQREHVRRCATGILIALLEWVIKLPPGAWEASPSLHDHLVARPEDQLAAFAAERAVALIDLDDPSIVLYPDRPDGFVSISMPHYYDIPSGSEWPSDLVPRVQQAVADAPQAFHSDLQRNFRIFESDEWTSCKGVDYVDAIRDILPDARFYVADSGFMHGSGITFFVMAPYGAPPAPSTWVRPADWIGDYA